MYNEDIAVAKSREVRATNDVVGNGATVVLLGQASNRIRVRFAVSAYAGAAANLFVIIQVTLDSLPVGIGILSSGVPYVEMCLEEHSQAVYGPFQAVNLTGAAVTIGAVEVLQNQSPE